MTERAGYTDHTGVTDNTAEVDKSAPAVPDYELTPELVLEDPAQYRALFEDTRTAIISLLSERAATVSEIAEVLGKPKGTIGHHMQVLADAGLVRVVRTKKVRALEARYWGRTARVFLYERVDAAVGKAQRALRQAADQVGRVEKAVASGEIAEGVLDVNRRDVRIPAEKAREYQRRLSELLVELASEPRSGDTTYAVLFALFPTDQPALRAVEEEQVR